MPAPWRLTTGHSGRSRAGGHGFLDAPQAWLPGLAVLALLPASELAVALVNRLATNRWRPEILPALELKDGVPDSLGTVLVVPILLGNENDIADQIEGLEVHYFANGTPACSSSCCRTG